MIESETSRVLEKLHNAGFTDKQIENMEDEELGLYIKAILGEKN